MRILLVEDNDRLAELVNAALSREGFTVDCAPELAEASAAVATVAYEALVLDLGLPDGDGLTLVRHLRAANRAVPILILSARDRLEDRIRGLNAGADDYLPKPFAMEELVARLRALLRRPPAVLPTARTIGNLCMDLTTQEVTVDDSRLELPRRERALLNLFMRGGGRLVTRSALEEALFGFNAEVGPNAIEVYVHRLRRRLAAAKASIAIRTERGVGYVLVAAGDGAGSGAGEEG